MSKNTCIKCEKNYILIIYDKICENVLYNYIDYLYHRINTIYQIIKHKIKCNTIKEKIEKEKSKECTNQCAQHKLKIV